MFERVAYPIVMENALDDIKTVAYRITRSNDEDGVGYGMKAFLKKKLNDFIVVEGTLW